MLDVSLPEAIERYQNTLRRIGVDRALNNLSSVSIISREIQVTMNVDVFHKFRTYTVGTFIR